MKYLTIDTTTKVTAVSLAEDGHLIAESFLHTAKTHSERLIPMLDQLLTAASWTLQELEMIGVVRGPGSFTGIRIGIATAQGLAQVLKLPLLAVLSLDALAWAGLGRVEDAFQEDAVCLIEWPEIIEDYLPEDRLIVEILGSGEQPREIRFRAKGSDWEHRLKNMA